MNETFSNRPFLANFNQSERMVLSKILKKGPITQSTITQECGLRQQSISRIVASLQEKGLVKSEKKLAEAKRGQQSQAFELVSDYCCSMGVAIMADTISIAIMDFSGTILVNEIIQIETNTPTEVISLLHERLADFEAKKLIRRTKMCGIGVAVTGYFVNEEEGFNTPPSLPDWAFINVRNLFSNEFHLPVWVDNDGNTAAIGESLTGVGKWADNFAYLYLSAGFGGGVIQDGKLYRGVRGNAGEFAGILPYNIYAHPTLELLRQSICRKGIELSSVYETVTKFDIEWPGVKEWILNTKDSFSLVASAISATLDNEVIVIGGRIPKVLAEELIPYIEFYSMARRNIPRPVPKIVAAEAVGEPTAIGAASLPFTNIFF